MSTQNRSDLKSHFTTGDIPTETDFSNLIDSVLVQNDDGIRFSGDGPLALESNSGDSSNSQNVLEIFSQFKDTNADWLLNLNPLSSSGTGNSTGLNIEDPANGMSRFFIQKTDGFVGIGNTEPSSELDVEGEIRSSNGSNYLSLQGGNTSVIEWSGSTLQFKCPIKENDGAAIKNALQIDSEGTLYVNGKYGMIRLEGNDSSTGYIVTDQLNIRVNYSGGSGYYTPLRINSNTKIGIGTQSPSATLHVQPVINGVGKADGVAPYTLNDDSQVFLVQSGSGDDLLKVANNGATTIPGTLDSGNLIVTSDYPALMFNPSSTGDHSSISTGSIDAPGKYLTFKTYTADGFFMPMMLGRNNSPFVGIGTKGPKAALHVMPYQSDSGSWNGEITQENANTVIDSSPAFLVQSTTANDALRVEADGVVKIGGDSNVAAIQRILAVSVSFKSGNYHLETPNQGITTVDSSTTGTITLTVSDDIALDLSSTICTPSICYNTTDSDSNGNYIYCNISARIIDANTIKIYIWDNQYVHAPTKWADGSDGVGNDHDQDDFQAVYSVTVGQAADAPFTLLVIQTAPGA